MHWYTDTCMNYNQGAGPEEGYLEHAQEATQEYTSLYATMQRGWSRCGEVNGHAHMY